MLSGWEFFKIYHSLKLHFTSKSYDVLKYNGKTSMSENSFNSRNDRHRFDSFAYKLIGKNKAGHFCIANLMYGSSNFIYEPFDQGYDVYLEWKKVRESMTREFQKDVVYLNQLAGSRACLDLFAETKSGKLPPILQVALAGKINPETVIILNKEHKEFFDSWTSMCNNDPYVSKTLLKWQKYAPFVSYDSDKIKTVLTGAKF